MGTFTGDDEPVIVGYGFVWFVVAEGEEAEAYEFGTVSRGVTCGDVRWADV